ncbi:MAG: stage II sporulation protein M [Clostridia bacterium]|nr:stage II sporulation protein M [Clostridia bacterium]
MRRRGWWGPRGFPVLPFLLVVLAAGVAAGSAAVQAVPSDTAAEVGRRLDVLYRSTGPDVPPLAVLRRALAENLATAAAVWGLGLTAMGVPLAVAALFARGFALGFTVGFLIFQEGLGGVVLAAGAVLPVQILAVPAWLGLALACAGHARRRRAGGRGAAVYAAAGGLCGVLLVAASAVQAFVAPAYLRLVALYL